MTQKLVFRSITTFSQNILRFYLNEIIMFSLTSLFFLLSLEQNDPEDLVPPLGRHPQTPDFHRQTIRRSSDYLCMSQNTKQITFQCQQLLLSKSKTTQETTFV